MRIRVVGAAAAILVLAGCAVSTRLFDPAARIPTVTQAGAGGLGARPRAADQGVLTPSEPPFADLGQRTNPPIGRMKPPSTPSQPHPQMAVPPSTQGPVTRDRCSTGFSTPGKKHPLPMCAPE